MWYGWKKTSNLDRMCKNHNHRINIRNRKIGKLLVTRNPNPQMTSHLRLPNEWEFVALRVHNAPQEAIRIYLYRGVYYLNCVLPTNVYDMHYFPTITTFSFSHHNTTYCYESYLRLLVELFARLTRPTFFKIRFRGKGYYMYKNKRNTIAPQFGFAHRVYVYAHAVKVNFLSKIKILLFGLSKRDLYLTAHAIRNVRPINIFTGRGIRFARQVIYKKTGKISSYR